MDRRVSRTIAEISERVAAGMSMSEIIRQDEIKRGYHLCLPGLVPWINQNDWDEAIISRVPDSRIVRIVLVDAKQPGRGAFRRLINGIMAAGDWPMVIEPMPRMIAILRRWGWGSAVYTYADGEAENRWSPVPISLM